ncbi:hypothetical protein P9209_11995 [Prescottella defluvii]|nr:hypothetical protein P9209_11995 [Prescottella defluvii]
MGTLIALEGLDGAGKRTLVGKVVARLEQRGLRVATLDFPVTARRSTRISRRRRSRVPTETSPSRFTRWP